MSFIIDSSTVKDSFEPIPQGDYVVRCTDAKLEEKAADKVFVVAQFKVVGGEHDGRVIFERFTVKHPNPKAVNVGLGKFKRFAKAAGATNPDQVDLMTVPGMQALATVKIEQSEGYDPKNVISNYKQVKTQTATEAGFPTSF